MNEISADYKPMWGVSYGHTFSKGSCDIHRIRGEFAIAIQNLCYRMRSYGIRANSYSGMIGFNNRELPDVGFRFITKANAMNRVEGNTHFLERNVT